MPLTVKGVSVVVDRGVLRRCRLQDEYYEFIEEPNEFVKELKAAGVGCDLFTFIQEIPDRSPRFSFYQEWDSAAVVTIQSFEHWWKKQVNDKTRNMIRKAQKSGVEIRTVAYTEELARGIQAIYNECPVRQGRPFKHFGKEFDAVWREHNTYLDRSEFLGAYHEGQLIGFAKLVHGRGISSLMNIISMISHRNKAPTNALIGKAVEICASRGVGYLQYGTGNEGSIGDFKKHHAFEEFLVPRYFVPVTAKGRLGLKLGLHRPLGQMIPQNWREKLTRARSTVVGFRYRNRNSYGAVPQPAERRAQA